MADQFIHTQITVALWTVRQARDRGSPLDIELAEARLDMLLDRMARTQPVGAA